MDLLDKSSEELEGCERLPFQAWIETGALVVMAGHITYPVLDLFGRPDSLFFSIITGVLRRQLCFDGLIVTDTLQMQAVSSFYSPEQAAVKAFYAGCDLFLMPSDLPAATQALLDAVSSGRITEEWLNQSLRRILEDKYENFDPDICRKGILVLGYFLLRIILELSSSEWYMKFVELTCGKHRFLCKHTLFGDELIELLRPFNNAIVEILDLVQNAGDLHDVMHNCLDILLR